MPPVPGKGGANHGPVNLKALDKATFRRLLSYLFSYKWLLAAVFVCILLSSLSSVIGTLFLQTIIDDYITPLMLQPDPVLTGLIQLIGLMAAVYAAGILASLFQGLLMAKVSQGVLKTIRDQMFRHMQALPIRYFDTHTHGDIMSHYTNDTDTLRQMITQSIPNLFSSAVTILAVFCAMVYTSPILTVFVLLSIAAMMLVTKSIGGKSAAYFVGQQRSLGAINGYIEEMIQGQKVVKVFCHEEKNKEVFDRKNEELCENATKANIYANIFMPVMANLGNLQYVLIAILGGALATVSHGRLLTLGGIAAFLNLSKSFTRPVTQISQQINSVITAMAGAQRIFQLLDEEPEQDAGYVTLVNAATAPDGTLTEAPGHTGAWAWKHPHQDGTVSYAPLEGRVEFLDVDFSYTPEKQVLHNVSLLAQPGQKIAFVGATGAGKTTITNLINRFYDIADGKIRYDGININKIKKPDLRRSLGVVLQDVNLFTGTVMDNIRYGKLDATDEECIAAAKLANAHEFIQMLPEGYNTVLSGDGAGLSQGQRQLLSIARAAVADPPVMILDEATSSIDTRTEALVQKGMDRLMRGRTCFVIAHRLSTVQNADRILVLEQGRVIEEGTHQELIDQRGQYYRLYTGAFELE